MRSKQLLVHLNNVLPVLLKTPDYIQENNARTILFFVQTVQISIQYHFYNWTNLLQSIINARVLPPDQESWGRTKTECSSRGRIKSELKNQLNYQRSRIRSTFSLRAPEICLKEWNWKHVQGWSGWLAQRSGDWTKKEVPTKRHHMHSAQNLKQCCYWWTLTGQ